MPTGNNDIYDNLPQELIKTIAEDIPRDRDMYSNTSYIIKPIICYYTNLAFNNEGVDYTFSEYYFRLQRIHMFFH